MRLVFDHLLLPSGWASSCAIDLDELGMIRRIGSPSEAGPLERVTGWALPAMPNLHSHAFQRALAGFTEHADPKASDSFWTWRERMYRLAERITPEDLEAISAQLYVEMLEAGMTAVGEFHYVHHDRGGARFEDRAQMSLGLLSAAEQAGIALTHLPVAYVHGGFNKAPLPEQSRFVTTPSELLAIKQRVEECARGRPLVRVGIAPHSLRAVHEAELRELVSGAGEEGPIHIHAAEQTGEVQDCLLHLGSRPVRWLLDHARVDARWCLVHATHIDDTELADLAASSAITGLCPTTEANLGDGIFPAELYLRAQGRFGIGSDSHISVSATEELRLLEYGQRLAAKRRNLLRDGGETSVGRSLWAHAARHGAHAIAQPIGEIAVGNRADVVVLDGDHPRLLGHGAATVLDAFVFGGADRAVRDVFVAGRRVVEAGRHLQRDAIRLRFLRAMQRLGGMC
jgi:formimidoylglutamate deiminase